MTSGDNRCAYVLTACVADAYPSIVGLFAVQLAFNRLAAKVVDHPPLGVLPGSGAEFWRVHTIQANRNPINNDGVSVPDIDVSKCRKGKKA